MNWSNIRKFLDSSTWIIFFGAIIFSFMTVVAQNALPGDSLYAFKLGYEKVMLASSRALNKQVDVQIEFVARRFNESTKVLASKYGSESLDRLNAEVESTAYSITMIEDPDEKKAAAKKYIAQLNVVSSGLGQQRMNIVRNNPSYSAIAATANNSNPPPSNTYQYTNTNTNTNTNTKTYNPTSAPPIIGSNTGSNNNGAASVTYPTAVPTQPPVVDTGIIGDIDNTQETIEETIEEMEQLAEQDVVPPPEEPTATPIPPTDTPAPTPTPEAANNNGPQGIMNIVPDAEPTRSEEDRNRANEWCQNNPEQCAQNQNRRNEENNND